MRILPSMMYDKRDYGLLTIVNDMLSRNRELEYSKRKLYPLFHPHGIKKLSESRGLRIAYGVIHLLNSLEIGKQDDRIGALRALRNEVLNASEGSMPRNTARALLQIMKELVRAQGNDALKLRLAHDFRATATGKPRIVRQQLRRYHLLEMPEEWNQLSFDDHVHDINTKGRKTATHLIMDAWIKGIRHLRVIYYNYIQAQFAGELLEAAEIMDIKLRIGIEFATCFRSRHIQLIWVPRGFVDTQAFLSFLTEAPVHRLMEEGRQVSDYNQHQVLQLLGHFNQIHLPQLNEAFGISLAPIDSSEFLNFVKPGQASVLHLAKFIHIQMLPNLKQKVDELNTYYASASSQEQNRYQTMAAEMNHLDVETILERFLTSVRHPDIPDTQNNKDVPDIPPLLKLSPRELLLRLVQLHSNYRITLNLTDLHPEDVLELIYDCSGMITRLEIFNLKNYDSRKTTFIPEISRLQNAINDGNVITLKRIIRILIDQVTESSWPDKADRIKKLTMVLNDISSLRLMYKGNPLKSRIGSDSTGQSPHMHGMGLAVIETLPLQAIRDISQSGSGHMVIPIRMTAYRRITFIPRKGVSFLSNHFFRWAGLVSGLRWLAQESRIDWLGLEYTTRMEVPGNIVTLGGIHEDAGNDLHLGNTAGMQPEKGQLLSWTYLNTFIKNILKLLIGFIPAFLTFALRYDWWVLKFGGAFIWFGITGIRNIVQSILGGGGLHRSPLLRWKDYLSWERICDSLLFTGFSVPLLDWLVKSLLLQDMLNISTTTHPVLLYTVMALSNGIYLSSHNAFRGFPKTVIAGNFFRSVLSIPIAILFNMIAGGILSAIGVSGIDTILQKWAAVISKAASDCIAGVIEGAADRYRNIHLRLRDYQDKLSRLMDVCSRLELLFPDKDLMETLDLLDQGLPGEAGYLEQIMIVHALDMLFIWNYQPQGRTALIRLAEDLSGEERQILLKTLSVLKKQRQISLLFIDGIIGKTFSRGLAFYLDSAPQYLKAVQELLNPVP